MHHINSPLQKHYYKHHFKVLYSQHYHQHRYEAHPEEEHVKPIE